MTPPFMNRYGLFEVRFGIIKDYREQALFCAGKWARGRQ